MASKSQTVLIYKFLEQHPRSTTRQIADALNINHKYCNKFVHELWRDGFLQKDAGVGNWFNPRKFSVVSEKKPRLGCGAVEGAVTTRRFKKKARQKLWNNIKIERKFSVTSILASIDAPKTTAYSYIRQLVRAGYVELVFDGKKAKGRANGTAENRYLLVRDTGRLAPIGRKDGCWDQNEQKLYPYTQGTTKRKALGKRKEDVTHDMA